MMGRKDMDDFGQRLFRVLERKKERKGERVLVKKLREKKRTLFDLRLYNTL